MMKKHAVLSALGRDRVGVADDLAAALATRKIDIEHSRMTALKGHFAVIVELCGAAKDVKKLQDDLDTLGPKLGCHLQMGAVGSSRPVTSVPEYWIESVSTAPSGIGAVTGVLKRYDINIDDLETDSSLGLWESAIMFRMKASITIPPTVSFARLREELHEVERERNLDIVIKPKTPGEVLA